MDGNSNWLDLCVRACSLLADRKEIWRKFGNLRPWVEIQRDDQGVWHGAVLTDSGFGKEFVFGFRGYDRDEVLQALASKVVWCITGVRGTLLPSYEELDLELSSFGY